MKTYTFTSHNSNETMDFASKLASQLHIGDVVVLSGELGAGKTKFTEGFLKYFGLDKEISSPTFNIVNEYKNSDITVYHFDVYRLEDVDEFYAIGGEEYFSSGICIIEWGELIKDALPSDCIRINFEKDINDENIRYITIKRDRSFFSLKRDPVLFCVIWDPVPNYYLINVIAITITPSTTLYIANTLKLPFFKYSNKNLITTIPTTKLEINPAKNAIESSKSAILTSTAANIIGVDNKNEYLAALSLSTFSNLATVIVIPDLDVPGNAAAIACDNPIKNDCLNVISSYFTSDADFLSTMYKTIPNTISAIPINNISIPNFSQIVSENLSNNKLTIPVGIVTATMYQNIFPSVDFFFFTTCSYPPFISPNQSLKKKIVIANNVPKCNAISKLSGIDFQLNIHGINFKCAELDIGNNSVNPCAIPKIIA